jgi:hypothetical protein
MLRDAKFDLHWGLYLRREYGCPDQGEMNGTTCFAGRRRIDYAEFLKAQKLAEQIFGLKKKD